MTRTPPAKPVSEARMSALDEAVSQRDKYRDALAEIASYHEHGRHSAITPAVLARKAEAALRNPVRNP